MRFLCGFFNRTPRPPPFSSMNSMPAASIAARIISNGQFPTAKLTVHRFEAGNGGYLKRPTPRRDLLGTNRVERGQP